MSTFEIIIALFGGLLAGTIFSLLLSKFSKSNVNLTTTNVTNHKNIPSISEKFETEQARIRYKTLKLEKELHTDALGRIFQAEGDGRITKQERELLSERYREQIKTLDNSLQDSELILEASELETLHVELTNLFTKKLSQIERRLNELLIKLETVKTFSKQEITPIQSEIDKTNESSIEEPPLITKKDISPIKVTNTQAISDNKIVKKVVIGEKLSQENLQPVKKSTIKKSKDTPLADEKVDAIRDEVLDALQRLEQLDVE